MMKKILLTCDVNHFPHGAFRWLKDLRRADPISVEGYFFMPVDYKNMYVPARESEPDRGRRLLDISKAEFERLCTENGIPFSVTIATGIPDKYELLARTRFNDLLVFSDRFFYSELDDNQPNPYMAEVLHGTECPAVIIPETYEGIDRIVFAYDGKEDCMFALKQFCYLLPNYQQFPIEIIHWDDHDGFIPKSELLEQFYSVHFRKAGLVKKPSSEQHGDWIGGDEKVMLLTGSFSRSSLSYVFRKSFAREYIHEGRIPVFIAHHN